MTTGAVWSRRLAAAVVTALGLSGIAWISDAPLSLPGSSRARLRLSWSARPERIETCREVPAAELEKLGEHMRQRVECEGRFASYLLRVTVDGSILHESIVKGAGLRNDRPIYLLEDFEIEPGAHRVSVGFVRREKAQNDSDDDDDNEPEVEGARADTGLSIGRAERENVERARRAKAAIPPRLSLDTTLSFPPGRVTVVTLDARLGALQVLAAAPPSK